MSNPGAELLRGVLEAPDDDPPRLVYADWLMEQGDPRGEFISLQVQLRQPINPARRVRARAREKALLFQHRARFEAPAKECGASSVFRRGFIDEIRVTAGDFAQSGAALLAVEPVRRARVQTITAADMKAMLAANLIGRLASLQVGYGAFDPAALDTLVGSEQLASLRYLSLGNVGLDDQGLAKLAGSPHFRCTRLALQGNEITDAGVEALAAWSHLSECTHLYLPRNQITDQGAAALAAAPLDRMLILSLGGNEIGDEGALSFATPELAAHLGLDLEGMALSDEARAELREVYGKRVKVSEY